MRKGIIYVYFNRAKYEKEGIEKYYVGQTVGTMEQRAGKDGRRYGWDDSNCNSKFAKSIRKWGWNSFEGRVLEEVDEEDLNELEKFYIKYFDSYKNGYNSTLGGEGVRGNNPYASKTEEEKAKISKKQSEAQKKVWKNPERREKQSEISSIVQKKAWKNPERREKQSEISSIVQKKRWEDEKEREKQSEIQKNIWKDKEYREKQNIARRKSWDNQERRKTQGKKVLGEKNGRAISVYCNELNIIFSYIKIAEKYCINVLNSKIGPIAGVCNGKRNFTGKLADGTKLTWKWVEDVNQEILDNAEYIDSEKYEEIIKAKLNENKKIS